jgi:hypothetical protein
MSFSVTFIDQHGDKHACPGVEAADEIEAAELALARLQVKYDALSRRRGEIYWTLEAARPTKGGPRVDLRLLRFFDSEPAGPTTKKPRRPKPEPAADVPPVDQAAAIAEFNVHVQRVEDEIVAALKADRFCSVATCDREWSGARIDPATGAWRRFCRVHNVVDWDEIYSLDAGVTTEPAGVAFDPSPGSMFD